MKTLLTMSLACTVGFVATMALIHYGPRHVGVTVAVIAGLALLAEWGNAVRDRRRRARWLRQVEAGAAGSRPKLLNSRKDDLA